MRKQIFFIFLLFISCFLPVLPAAGEQNVMTDETGRKIKVSAPVRRIISLAPNITEILFALGLENQIAGVTDFCDYPAGVANKTRIGGFVNPDMERIVSLKPDLIVGTRDGNRAGVTQRLEELGLTVYLVDPRDFNGVVSTIRNIGEVTGRGEESRRIAERMTKKKDAIVRLTQSLPRSRVFFQIGNAPIVTVGKGTLGDDLIRMAGGKSISENESANYPLYSIENVISKAPEIIIMTSMEGNREYANLAKKWQRWGTIPAVKKNAIHVIDSNLVDRPSPRIADGLEALLRIIHPEVAKNLNSP